MELINLKNINKHARKYSKTYIDISSISYIFSSLCNKFIHNYISLPDLTSIRKHIYPDINKFLSFLFKTNDLKCIINEFLPKGDIKTTLAVDATYFKEVSGDTYKNIFKN